MASDILYRIFQPVRGNMLVLHGLLFPISSKDSFICTIPDRIAHTTAFVYTSRGALAGMKNISHIYHKLPICTKLLKMVCLMITQVIKQEIKAPT